MKRLFIYIIVISFFSCSSPNKIIENYLLEEIKKDTIKTNVLLEEKINFKEAFRIFQGMKVLPKTDEELKINDELKKKYFNDFTENWIESNFKRVNFDIVSKDSIDLYILKRRTEFNNKIKADWVNMFSISKPYYYNNNKNIFFNIVKFRIFRNRIYNNVIIMNKQNGKWVVVEKRENGDL